MYEIVRDVFRDDEAVNVQDIITSAVFIVELINIDLFNMCYHHHEKKDFEGIVYRGITLPEEDFTLFERLVEEPIGKRYISIPSSLWSSSKNIKVGSLA